MFDRQGAFETQGINLIASNNQANSPFGGWKCLHFFLRWTQWMQTTDTSMEYKEEESKSRCSY